MTTGVVLAGGRSSRMGRNKALLDVGGRRIVDRVFDALGSVTDRILVVRADDPWIDDIAAARGALVVQDRYPGAGSLGGIYTGLAAAGGEAAFTVACDMPFLRADVARLVIGRAAEGDVVIPRLGDQLETMHAVYTKRCLPHMEERLRAGRLKIVGFFDRVRVVEVPEADVRRVADPEVVFMNVNTPDELAHAREIDARESA